jgi:hypothetical protein
MSVTYTRLHSVLPEFSINWSVEQPGSTSIWQDLPENHRLHLGEVGGGLPRATLGPLKCLIGEDLLGVKQKNGDLTGFNCDLIGFLWDLPMENCDLMSFLWDLPMNNCDYIYIMGFNYETFSEILGFNQEKL